jgi:predicted Zn-dependent protease
LVYQGKNKMSARPTPETDSEQHEGLLRTNPIPMQVVTANFARRLERERDEAREELRDIRLNLGADAEGYTLLHAVCALQNERDEARAVAGEMADVASKHLSFLLAVTPTKANEQHEKETIRVIDVLKRWKKS